MFVTLLDVGLSGKKCLALSKTMYVVINRLLTVVLCRCVVIIIDFYNLSVISGSSEANELRLAFWHFRVYIKLHLVFKSV